MICSSIISILESALISQFSNWGSNVWKCFPEYYVLCIILWKTRMFCMFCIATKSPVALWLTKGLPWSHENRWWNIYLYQHNNFHHSFHQAGQRSWKWWQARSQLTKNLGLLTYLQPSRVNSVLILQWDHASNFCEFIPQCCTNLNITTQKYTIIVILEWFLQHTELSQMYLWSLWSYLQ